MSDLQAIATVTESLKGILSSALNDDLPRIQAKVTTTRPKEPSEQDGDAKVNIFLYQVTPNTAYRNMDLPTRSADGRRLMQKPVIAFDLHYLLSMYGDESKQIPQLLLGLVARTMHEHPVITREDIEEALKQDTEIKSPQPSLVDEFELVKFTLESFSLEELSKLWSVFFQTPYALSLAYQATVVLIESNSEPQPGPPIRERNIVVLPLPKPLIQSVVSSLGDDEPIHIDSTIHIRGERLRGDKTRVLLGGVWIEPQSVAPKQVAVHLPSTPVADELLAGNQPVQIMHVVFDGSAPSGFESNVFSFPLRSKISDDVQYDSVTKEVTMSAEPKIGSAQRVVMFLDEVPPGQNGNGQPAASAQQNKYIFPAPPRTEPSNTITVPTENVVHGHYYVRLLIDGVESALNKDADGNITGPIVNITESGIDLEQLRSQQIELSVLRGSDRLSVEGTVMVQNEDDESVAGADVTVEWSWQRIERVENGLVAFYDFLEGNGSEIQDKSPTGDALNLQISDTSQTTWLPDGGLHFRGDDVKAQAVSAPAKIFDRLTASNKLSIEAWVEFDDVSPRQGETSPDRIVSFSGDFQNRNFTFGQLGPNFVLRLRTPESGNNGSVPPFVVNEVLQARLMHLVATFDGTTAWLYVDGVRQNQTLNLTGGFANWDNSYSFLLANEVTSERQWKGKLYLVAIYDRDLSLDEVVQNFNAGRPVQPSETEPEMKTETTGNNGKANFLSKKGSGKYTIEVKDIAKEGGEFDTAGSSELRKHIDAQIAPEQVEPVEPPEEPAPLGKLHVQSIAPFAQQVDGKVRVTAVVHIQDQNGDAADSPTVTGEWTRPDSGGAVERQTKIANNEGICRFVAENGDGEYTLKIINVEKAGYAFDPTTGITEITRQT